MREEGLIHESTKADLRNLKEVCECQAEDLLNVNKRLDALLQIIAKLK